jgi:hypothetical protein
VGRAFDVRLRLVLRVLRSVRLRLLLRDELRLREVRAERRLLLLRMIVRAAGFIAASVFAGRVNLLVQQLVLA